MRLLKSLRFRLILLVLLAAIPILVISAITGLAQIRDSRARTLDDAYRLTRLVSDYQLGLIQNTRLLLQYIAFESELQSPDKCRAFLDNLNRNFGIYASFSLADLKGNVYCASAPSQSVVNIADRSYFQKTLATHQIITGSPVTGRLTGKTIQPVAIPIFDNNQQIKAVLIGSLDLNQVIAYAKNLDMPAQSAMLVVDQNGTILLRYPSTETWSGKRVPDVPIVRQILNSSSEGYAELAGVDGVKRLYAFTPFPVNTDEPIFISIGIPSSVANAEPNRLLVTNLALISLAALLAIATAWFGGDILFLRIVSLTAERDAAEAELQAINADLEARVEQRTGELARAVDQLQVELVERQRMVEILRQRGAELNDLTHRLEQSNTDLQDFAFIASHDLQEPLRKIQAFGDRLVKDHAAQLDQEGILYADRMSRSAHRLQAMINALLTYSRINFQEEKFEPTDLNKVLSEVISDLEITLRDAGGQVQVNPLPVVDADPVQIHQLLQNLIGNAIKFHRPNTPPLVKVKVSAQDNHTVTLVIEDNGIGFNEKYLDRIFQPFQRLNSLEQFEGSGIGLAVSRKIIERHHGQISAASVPGEGSWFIVTLPLKQRSNEEEHSNGGEA